jgi:hypothetical protein
MPSRGILVFMLRAGLMSLLLPLAAAPLTAVSAERQVRVTTDSSAYCQELAARFADQRRAATAEARALAEEGVKLCDEGHARTGIAKLRRALRAAQAGG